MDGITSGQTPTAESKKLALPPVETVEQVKRYAVAHGVQVEIPSSSPD
jgi:predicted type IV restriction endonuclease